MGLSYSQPWNTDCHAYVAVQPFGVQDFDALDHIAKPGYWHPHLTELRGRGNGMEFCYLGDP